MNMEKYYKRVQGARDEPTETEFSFQGARLATWPRTVVRMLATRRSETSTARNRKAAATANLVLEQGASALVPTQNA